MFIAELAAVVKPVYLTDFKEVFLWATNFNSSSTSNSARCASSHGEPWFVGKDVATALGYSDAFAALKQHVPDKFKRVLNAKEFRQMESNQETGETPLSLFDSMDGVQRLTFVNEAGMYRLVMRSKLPKAEEFTDWVCGDVLPSIRKTGSYSLVAPAAKKVPAPKRRAGQLSDACVYVSLMSNGTVKIGRSNNVAKRLSNIKSQNKLAVVKEFHTPFMSRKAARLIEKTCHKIFSPSKIDGEFFSVKFETACAVLDSFVKVIETLSNSKIFLMPVKIIADRKRT